MEQGMKKMRYELFTKNQGYPYTTRQNSLIQPAKKEREREKSSIISPYTVNKSKSSSNDPLFTQQQIVSCNNHLSSGEDYNNRVSYYYPVLAIKLLLFVSILRQI